MSQPFRLRARKQPPWVQTRQRNPLRPPIFLHNRSRHDTLAPEVGFSPGAQCADDWTLRVAGID